MTPVKGIAVLALLLAAGWSGCRSAPRPVYEYEETETTTATGPPPRPMPSTTVPPRESPWKRGEGGGW